MTIFDFVRRCFLAFAGPRGDFLHDLPSDRGQAAPAIRGADRLVRYRVAHGPVVRWRVSPPVAQRKGNRAIGEPSAGEPDNPFPGDLSAMLTGRRLFGWG